MGVNQHWGFLLIILVKGGRTVSTESSTWPLKTAVNTKPQGPGVGSSMISPV